MPSQPTEASQRTAARIAGVAFLIIVIGWTLNWILVDSKIVVAGDAGKTIANVRAEELLFRLGLANELIFAVCGIVLGFALCTLLEQVNRNLALLALNLKLAEATLAASLVLAAFLSLQMLDGSASPLEESLGRFLTVRSTGSAITMAFLGLDSILFFSLLFKSRYVPRALAGLGVFAYALIFIQSFLSLLVSVRGQTAVTTMSLALFAPSILFELLAGLWLLIKGVKTGPQPAAPASTRGEFASPPAGLTPTSPR